MIWALIIIGIVVVSMAMAILLVARRRREIEAFRRDLESYRSEPAPRQGRWRAVRLPRNRPDRPPREGT